MIINGTTMEATEAAGEYISNPVYGARLLKMLGFQPDSKVGMFEVLQHSGWQPARRLPHIRIKNLLNAR
jgi:hypothetical protein